MLSLCNNSLRKTAKSYKPKKNMGNKDIDLDSEEELDFEVLLEAEEETSELIEYQEFTTNEDIGQCFTDSLSSL